MTNIKTPVTKNGEIKLKEELEKLKFVERPRIINSIAEARAHGDLKENAEYHAAREEQSFVEGRISNIEAKLSNCVVVDITKIENEGKVIFGSTVTLSKTDNKDKSEVTVTYTIVGEDEANIKENKISVNSPIAKAIIGKEEGDLIDVETPSGVISYEIDSVEYV